MWCRNRLHFLIGETCFFDIRSRYFDESQISAHFRTFQNQIQFADFSYLCDRNAAKKGQMLYWMQRGSKQLEVVSHLYSNYSKLTKIWLEQQTCQQLLAISFTLKSTTKIGRQISKFTRYSSVVIPTRIKYNEKKH